MSKLVDAARGYLGVKWRHRGRSRHGLDCAGLVKVAYADCGVELTDYTLYGREPFEDGLVKHLTTALGQPLPSWAIEPLCDGDVIVQRFDREPHHVAIVAAVDYGGVSAWNLIHADGQVGKVVEVRLDLAGIRRITHVFRRAV